MGDQYEPNEEGCRGCSSAFLPENLVSKLKFILSYDSILIH
jgi:hypothetical protein